MTREHLATSQTSTCAIPKRQERSRRTDISIPLVLREKKELVKSVEAEAAAKKSAEEAQAWQASFNASLQRGRKEGLLREAQQEQQRCEEAEVNASKRETRMRSLLNTHKKHLALCDLQVELPAKEARRLEAKAAFDKAEKDLLEAQKKLESLASEEAETHESIGKTYKELEELKVEHSIAEKEYNDQDAQLLRNRRFPDLPGTLIVTWS
eukprot:s1854_g14.t1